MPALWRQRLGETVAAASLRGRPWRGADTLARIERLEILDARKWQMSPGDRAALEGIVSSLRPGHALEIGSADGGSLERIALHSGHVHSFDLVPPPAIPANVTVHTGDSHELLGEVLAELGGGLDFAHVDGDHSYDGALADLRTLIDSERVGETVILVHDCFHQPVRAAFRMVAAHPKVTFADVDFVPGRMIANGFSANQLWGGFGLLLVGFEPPVVEIGDGVIRYHDAYQGAHRASKLLRKQARPLHRLRSRFR